MRKTNLSPEAERYHTRSPYDFDSSDDSSFEDFALDTNCVPGSAQQPPLFAQEGRSWSTTNHFGDGKDTPRSMSIYSHPESHSVYSVDTQGFPPALPSIDVYEMSGARRPMSSMAPPPPLRIMSPTLMSPASMAVAPLFHRISLNQYSASPNLNSGLASPTSFVGEEYEEEIEELARDFLEERQEEEDDDGKVFDSAV